MFNNVCFQDMFNSPELLTGVIHPVTVYTVGTA